MTENASHLASDESRRIYEQRVRPDVLAGALPAASPVAMIVAGQPGSGVACATARLRRDLTNTAGTSVHLSADRLRAYHPYWRAWSDKDQGARAATLSDVSDWYERIIQDALKQNLNLVLEVAMRDPKAIQSLARQLRREKYTVQAVVLATTMDESRIATLARYDMWRECGLPPTFVPGHMHDAAYLNVRLAVAGLEQKKEVDGLRLIQPDGTQIFENRLIDGDWSIPAEALARLDRVRERVPGSHEVIYLALRWDTLAQRLVGAQDVPREVASQAIVWRNEAVRRAEATPETARMLQWAREADAFRTMDRFEYEKAFPHNARAVQMYSLAVLESEKYETPEGERMRRASRENLAGRIERGEIARIAAAQKKALEPRSR